MGSRLAAVGVVLAAGLAGALPGGVPAVAAPAGESLGPVPAPVAVPVPVPERYRPVDLGAGRVTAMNDRDEVVGFDMVDDGHTGSRALLWSGGRRIELPTLGGRDAQPYDINNRGDVVGFDRTVDGDTHAVLWSGRRVHDLGTLGGFASHATAISDDGTVVGASLNADGVTRPFVWRHGRMADLGDLVTSGEPPSGPAKATGINNHGAIVITDARGWLLWDRGRGTRVLASSRANDPMINNRGDVAGEAYYTTHECRPEFIRDGVRATTVLNFPGVVVNDSRAQGINDSGTMVGWALTQGTEGQPTSSADLVRRTWAYLQEYPATDRVGVDLGARGLDSTARVWAINNRNHLAGSVTVGGRDHAALFVGTPV